jgi:hypothetical protein
MRGLRRRIERMARHDGGTICPECGNAPGAPVVFTFDTAPTPERTMPAQRCPRCGAIRWFTIAIDSVHGIPDGGSAGEVG